MSTEKSGIRTRRASRMERVCAVPAANETNEPAKASKTNTTLPAFKDSLALPKPCKRPSVLTPHPLPSCGSYVCKVCQMQFSSYRFFVKHKEIHNVDRPFPCEVCGKHFLKWSHYTEHQRSHTGERPFPCEHCERSFTTNHNLKRHLALHSKDDMYRCKVCAVRFCHRLEHRAMQPDPELEPELESSSTEPPNNTRTASPTNNVTLINKLQQNPEPRQSSEVTDDTQSTSTPLPLPTPTAQTLPPPLYAGPSPQNLVPPPPPPEILPHTCPPPPPYPDHSSQPHGPPPPYPTHFLQFRGPPPPYSTQSSSQTSAPPSPGPSPPSLTNAPPLPCPRPLRRMCIPISLTSAFLEVKRNCEFTCGKTSALWFNNCNVKKRKKNKKKMDKRSKEKDEMDKNQSESSGLPSQIIAYDIEVIL